MLFLFPSSSSSLHTIVLVKQPYACCCWNIWWNSFFKAFRRLFFFCVQNHPAAGLNLPPTGILSYNIYLPCFLSFWQVKFVLFTIVRTFWSYEWEEYMRHQGSSTESVVHEFLGSWWATKACCGSSTGKGWFSYSLIYPDKHFGQSNASNALCSEIPSLLWLGQSTLGIPPFL